MKTIVTHPGHAHRDEFISCCLLIAAGKADRIDRRDCTAEDLANPDVIVLDQGSRHEPELLNFDHHQFDRDADPACSITLILPYLDIDVDKARSIWGWLEFSELLDSKGPTVTAEKLGSTPDALYAGVSPIEATVVRWFQEEKELYHSRTTENLTDDDGNAFLYEHLPALYELMYRIGSEKLNYLREVVERVDLLRENAQVIEVGGLKFLDATFIHRTDSPNLGLETYAQELGDIAGTITQDDRGDGVCLFRRNDHPDINFSRLEGRDGVRFAHKGGFVAKLEADVDPLPMLIDAISLVADPFSLFQRKQHVIDVRLVCNDEPVPGWGNDPQDMVKAAAQEAARVLMSYDPVVISSGVTVLKVDDLSDSETSTLLGHMTKEQMS